jgi:hypothetical protein
VRDEYLRPIVDAQGIYNRLTFDEKDSEERVFVEAITNQYESREALKYAGGCMGGWVWKGGGGSGYWQG